MTEWIPCAERLPDVTTECLVWMHFTKSEIYSTKEWLYSFGWYFRGWHTVHEMDPNAIEVIAWMPLPKPYKQEQEDTDEEA